MAFEVPQPINYPQQPNLGQTLVGAAGTIFQGYQAGKANEANQNFQAAFGQAYAKGDYNAMQQLAATYPQQWQQVQQGMTAINDNNRQQLGTAASDISLAAASGDPTAVLNVAQRHAPVLQGLGVSPQELATAYQQNPQQVRQYADMIGAHSLGPKDYFTLQNDQVKTLQQGQYQQGQLQLGAARTKIAQQQADQQGQYQQGQLQQGQQRLSLDGQFNQAKMLDMQVNRQLQQGKNTAEIAALQNKSLQAKQGVVDGFDQSMNSLNGMLSTLQQVQQIDPNTFNATFGISGKINRAIPGSAEGDAWNTISQMQSQARLMGVIGMKGTGPVSDAEGQAAAAAFLALDPSTSPAQARKAINNWNNVLQKQMKYQQSRAPQVEQYRQQIQSAYPGPSAGGAAAPAGNGAAASGAVNWNDLK